MKTIALVAPASPASDFQAPAAQKVKAFFEKRGYRLKIMLHVFDAERFMAGTDEARAADLNACFADPQVDAVIALRGGAGSMRLLDKIDYRLVKKNPKPLFGFSDLTALQAALWQRAGLVSWTGFQASFIYKRKAGALHRAFEQALRGDQTAVAGLREVVPGKARGVLVGGTLSVLAGLCGTPYMPRTDGCILFLEEVNEKPYRVDRLLTQLRLAGAFNRLAALVLGDFSTCLSTDKEDGTVRQVLDEHFAHAAFPVARGLKYGHAAGEIILPVGARAALDTQAGTLAVLPMKRTK